MSATAHENVDVRLRRLGAGLSRQSCDGELPGSGCAEHWASSPLFHDQTEVPIGFTNRNNAPMSKYTAIVVGATYYQSSSIISSPFTIRFDDLALDDERIGCE